MIVNLNAQNVSCFGLLDGQIAATVAGGTPFNNNTYLYAWNNGATTSAIGNLAAGNFAVTVTDARGCTATASTVLTSPQQILVSVTNISHVDCSGSSNGAITIAATGGTNNTFEFSNDGGLTFIPGTSPFTFSNLAGGTYQLVVRDASNASCEVVRSVQVLENNGLTLSVTTQGVACAGGTDGSATVSATGGSGSFTYLWSNGQTTATATGLTANAQDSVFIATPYAVTVTDANGCSATAGNIAINAPDSFNVEGFVLQNVSCFAGNDGVAYAVVTGGSGSYTIAWSNGATTDTIRGVEAFNYLVVATDANGCSDTATVAITEPTFPLVAALSGDTTSCFGSRDGIINIDSIIGGTPFAGNQYEFSLRAQGPFGSASVLSQGLPAGIYTVFVRDSNECVTRVDSIVIRQPADLVVTAYRDTTIRLGETVTLYATVNNTQFDSSLVTWSYIDQMGTSVEACRGANCLGSFTPDVNILYEDRVFVVNLNNGCGDTSSVTVRVNRRQTLFVPNVFTPNGDGVNDIFTVYAGGDVRTIKRFLVFDRWGELVHEASDFAPGSVDGGWDGTFKGKKMNPGVFVYYVEAETIDGQTTVRKGDVTLAR
jgi:gliding motility-associated-like protein